MSETSLGRGTVLLLLSRAAGLIFTLANSVILARALGVERLGAYAYGMGLAALFGLLPNLGINHVVTRAIAQDPQAGAGVVRAGLRAQACLAGGVLVAIPLFAAMLPGQPVPLGIVALAAAQMALGTLSWPYLAVLGGRTRYDRVASVELASAAVGTATLVAAVAFHRGVEAALLAHLVAAGVSVAITRWATRPFLPTGGGPEVTMAALLRQAAPFGAATAVQSMYTRLDVILLGQLASTRALGLYNVAYKPTNMLNYFGSTVAGPMFPLIAQATKREAPPAFQRAMRGLGAAGPAMALALSGLAGPLLRLLYGAEYVTAAPVLAVLAWSAAANWLYAPLAMALQARGQERRWLACLLCALVINGAGNMWAIPRWSALGAAATTLASELALLGLGAALLWRKLGIPPAARPVVVGLGATAAAGVVLWALGGWGSFAGTAVALLVYGSFLLGFRVVTAEDAAILLGWFRKVGPAMRGQKAAV